MIWAAVSEPSQVWVNLLANNGLAIVIVMFLLFVICPAIGAAAWVSMRWGSARVDKVIDGHMTFMTTTSGAIQNLVNATVEGHSQHYELLNDVKTGVNAIHERLDHWHPLNATKEMGS